MLVRIAYSVTFLAGMIWVAPVGFRSSTLSAQSLNLQPGAGIQTEKFPTPRDPSYVPPLLPQSTLDEANAGDAGGSALIFSAGGGGDLVALFAERRKAQVEAARRADRYGERNAQYLDETGQDRVLVEQNLLRQFGTSRGFPRDFGEAHYSESPGRRFSIVFFLALPITSLLAGGLYQLAGPGITVNGPADYPALLGVIGAGSALAALIGYYDYSQMQELRSHTVGHRAREAYDLRNHPFGRRGVKDADTAENVDPDSGAYRDAGDDSGEASPVSRLAPLYFQKTWRSVAETEARNLLRASSGARRATNPDNTIRETPGSRLGVSWRFSY